MRPDFLTELKKLKADIELREKDMRLFCATQGLSILAHREWERSAIDEYLDMVRKLLIAYSKFHELVNKGLEVEIE